MKQLSTFSPESLLPPAQSRDRVSTAGGSGARRAAVSRVCWGHISVSTSMTGGFQRLMAKMTSVSPPHLSF